MTNRWTGRAATIAVLAGLVAACASNAPVSSGFRTVTSCGGATITVPIGGDVPSAACSHGPMTTPTPYPVSDADAAKAASQLSGVREWARTDQATGDMPAYLLTGPGAMAVVDGESGRAVLYAVLGPDLVTSDGSIPSWSPAPSPSDTLSEVSAKAAARAWATAHGFKPDAYPTTQRFEVAGISGWRVGLTDTSSVSLEIRIVDGQVIGVLVTDPALDLRLPVVGRDTAIALAIEKTRQVTGNAGEQVISAEFNGSLMNGHLAALWLVATGIPTTDSSGNGPAWELGIVAEVDAMSGELIVDKGP